MDAEKILKILYGIWADKNNVDLKITMKKEDK